MIDRDAWLKALGELSPPLDTDPEAVTAQEFAGIMQRSHDWAATRLAQLVVAGKARATRKYIVDILDRKHLVPAYRLVEDVSHEKPSDDGQER